MKIELQDLEGKVQSLVEMCQRLRAENHQLRQQLAASQNENARLNEKVSVAAERIEALLEAQKRVESANAWQDGAAEAQAAERTIYPVKSPAKVSRLR